MLKKLNILLLCAVVGFLSFANIQSVKAATNIDTDNNSSFNTATSISMNTRYQGHTSYSDDDYYKFALTTEGNVTLYLSNGYNSSYISLYDADGNTIKQSLYNSPGKIGDTTVEAGLPKGTYYIRINGSNNTDYEFSANFTASKYYEAEINDTYRNATPIILNQLYKGTLQGGSSDVDYFKFTLSAPGNVKLSGSNADGSKAIAILDGEGNRYASISTKVGYEGNSTAEVGLPTGTYFVKIESVYYSSSDIKYDFSVNYTKSDFYEKELDDSFSTASSMVLNQSYKGTLQGDENDYYKFNLPSSTNVSFELSNTNRYKYLYVYDQNGEYINSFSSKDNGSGTSSMKLSFAKGNYYVKIGNPFSSYIPYQFIVKATFSTPTLATTQVAVTNNTGKSDVVSVSKLKTGDIVKVYNKSGKLLGTSKAVASGTTSTTVSISQIGKEKGSIFVTVTSPTMKESSKKEFSYVAEKISETLKSSQVSIKSNKGKNDTVTVNGLQAGYVVKVYDSKGKLISTSKAVEKGKTSTSLSIKQLGTKKGSIQVTVTVPGKLESSKVSKSFSGEVTSSAPTVSNVSASVSMTVKKLKEGDIVKVYNESGKVISTSKAVGKGKSSISVSVAKQVSKQEKFYITVTSKGAEESSKVTVYL